MTGVLSHTPARAVQPTAPGTAARLPAAAEQFTGFRRLRSSPRSRSPGDEGRAGTGSLRHTRCETAFTPVTNTPHTALNTV
ncbi:hypothetical protein [Streptomyces sp. OR43]|uniref:hypothetical protein n=1 Tax=Streptomyces sp. or43 TaxID=2478957 RepID=UPI0011CE8348|nr:hypothetical protein [Streptomyces sp. or43]